MRGAEVRAGGGAALTLKPRPREEPPHICTYAAHRTFAARRLPSSCCGQPERPRPLPDCAAARCTSERRWQSRESCGGQHYCLPTDTCTRALPATATSRGGSVLLPVLAHLVFNNDLCDDCGHCLWCIELQVGWSPGLHGGVPCVSGVRWMRGAYDVTDTPCG